MARGVGRESERELLASKSHFVRYLWPPSPTSILPVHFALPFILTSGESLEPGARAHPWLKCTAAQNFWARPFATTSDPEEAIYIVALATVW